MQHIPQPLLSKILEDPEYKTCARYGWHQHICEGRITFDHAVIFAGKQLQERWAIVPLCARGHNVDQFQDVGDHNPTISLWIALNRALPEDLARISKAFDYRREKERLNEKYGVWKQLHPDPKELAAQLAAPSRTAPVAFGMNYYISEEELKKVDIIVRFHREVLGVFMSRPVIISDMIDESFQAFHDDLKKVNPELYKLYFPE